MSLALLLQSIRECMVTPQNCATLCLVAEYKIVYSKSKKLCHSVPCWVADSVWWALPHSEQGRPQGEDSATRSLCRKSHPQKTIILLSDYLLNAKNHIHFSKQWWTWKVFFTDKGKTKNLQGRGRAARVFHEARWGREPPLPLSFQWFLWFEWRHYCEYTSYTRLPKFSAFFGL